MDISDVIKGEVTCASTDMVGYFEKAQKDLEKAIKFYDQAVETFHRLKPTNRE